MSLSFLQKLKNPNSHKILTQLHALSPLSDGKISLKTYALKLSGNSYDELGLITVITDAISDYVFGTDQKKKAQSEGKEPYRDALAHFGGVPPISNGKYGELILYLLVESVLGTPMVCHKMQSLSNGNDQVKGADGVFLGDIDNTPTRLIGESKIRCDFSLIVPDFIGSLEKYHDNIGSRSFELFVAQRNLSQSLNNEEVEIVKKYFDPTSDEYKAANLLHPVLLVYKDESIEKKLNDTDVEKIEEEYVKEIESSFKSRLEEIKKKVEKSKYVKSAQLVVFLIPLRDTEKFRFDVFSKMHGMRHHGEQDYYANKKKEEKEALKSSSSEAPIKRSKKPEE